MLISTRRRAAAAAIGLAIPVLLGPAAHAAVSSGPAPSAALKSYQQVQTTYTDNPNAQTEGTAVCPAKTTLVGGGAVIESNDILENVNSSYPLSGGGAWVVFVDNQSSTAGSFRVYAECVKKVAKYQIVAATPVDNPADTQNTGLAVCPSKTVALAGGVYTSSTSPAVALNGSLPAQESNGWRVYVNNLSTSDETFTTYVICGKKPAGYAIVVGPGTPVVQSAQGHDSVACPSGTVVLGGGGFTNSGPGSDERTVDLNSVYPFNTSTWEAYADDTSTVTTTVYAWAVCAKAK